MPTNKNAIQRYKLLDNYLQRKDIENTLEGLLSRLRDGDIIIEKRTLIKDIKDIENIFGDKIKISRGYLDRKKCYYYYEKDDQSIFTVKLSEEDKQVLEESFAELRNLHGIIDNSKIDSIICSLEMRFGLSNQNANNVVSFEHYGIQKGIEYLNELIEAATKEYAVEMKYRTFKGKSSKIIFHPHHLRQYNRRWFVFGIASNEPDAKYSIRALDRIQGLKRVNKPFIPNMSVAYPEIFEDMIGVSDAGRKQTIELKFAQSRFPFVKSKPMHPSQRIIDEENCIITLNIKTNKELEARIFEYGTDVEVLKPKWLRDRFREFFRKGCEMYGDDV